MKKYAEQRKTIEDINIVAWNMRIGIIYIGYTIEVLVGLFNLSFPEVENSLSVVILVSVVCTFINNFLENTIVRYEATPRVYTYNS